MKKEQSCGALVYQFNQDHREFLLVKHQHGNHIGFPKGHIEPHETMDETAKREVFEETGLKTYIYKDHQASTIYEPKTGVTKTVTYFIGRPVLGQLQRQEDEVSDVFWCHEDQIEKMVTFQNDRDIFHALYPKILHTEENLPLALLTYIDQNILPQYDQFDDGHHRDHIYEVVHASFELIKQYPARKDMVYLVACFHDLGLQFGRKTHHITSGDLLKEDPYVIKHYTDEEIHVMVDAIFDHRASNETEPRTIYGKILAEADRLLNADTVIQRTVLYELHHHPNLTLAQNIKNAHQHIIEKYGKRGYLKRYLYYEPNDVGEKALQHLINHPSLLLQKLEEIFKKTKKYVKNNIR